MELPQRRHGPLRAFGVLSSRGAALLLQVGLLAVIGRALGVEGLGLFALFVGWLSIVGTLGAFGAPMHSPRDPSPFEYIERWSAWMDLRILVRTPLAMVRGGR